MRIAIIEAGTAFWAFLAIFAAVLPVGHTTALRYAAFAGMVAATAWRCARRREMPAAPLTPSWLLYGGVALLSLCYAVDIAYSAREIKTEILYGYLILVVAATWIRDPRALERLLWIIASANVPLVVYTIAAAALRLPQPGGLLGSFQSGPGQFSTYVVTVLPFIAALGWSRLQRGKRLTAAAMAGLVLLNVVAVALTLNRQSLVALLVETGVISVAVFTRAGWSWRKAGIFCALAAALAVAAAIQFAARIDNSGGDEYVRFVEEDPRWHAWQYAAARIAERPLSGGGFGREAFDLAYPAYHDAHPFLWHAHNILLNKGVQMGLPGVLAFVILYGAVLRRLYRLASCHPEAAPYVWAALAMAVGVLAKNMTDDFFVRDGALLFWMLVGAVLGSTGAGTPAGQAATVRSGHRHP